MKKKANKEIPPNSVTFQSGISNRHSRTKGDVINRNVYKNTDKYKPLIILIVILIIIVLATIYYFTNANKLERRSNLVGDKVCSSFPNEKGQDNCCFNFHKEEIHVQCVGNWRYIEGIEECQFVCENASPVCPEDAKQCPGNKVVRRNPDLECNFDDC